MTDETAEFVIYIINAIANAQSLYPSHVYKTLQETGCIQKYLVPFYDVLHTLSFEDSIEAITAVCNQHGGLLKYNKV